MRRFGFVALITALLTLVAAVGSAQAIVVSNGTTTAGVALVPGTQSDLGSTGFSPQMASPPCHDPWLAADLSQSTSDPNLLPARALCYRGGPVMHHNETFSIAWDPVRRYFATTRNYVETFLSDVANGSGTLTSPYAATPQYQDAGGRAGNSSLFGGGCIDYGDPGGFTCEFGNTSGTGTGHSYPTAGNCPVSGTDQFHETLSGTFDDAPNTTCVTDAQIQQEVTNMYTSANLSGHLNPHDYTPTVMVLLPSGVVSCLDNAGSICSANARCMSATALCANYSSASNPNLSAIFCSYHSHVNVGGKDVAYVVQPWTASWETQIGCDDPGLSPIPSEEPIDQLAIDVGKRLVSPLSQGHIAAIVNPQLNAWAATNGTEMNDNGCVPFPTALDQATVGNSGQNPYFLQREFNNAGVIETDPNALSCTADVLFQPNFVLPSTVAQGDVIQLDGSTTVSSLIVPKNGYQWSFGDGTTGVGPSVVHSYGKSGSYSVTLTVTDRGGNKASLTQVVVVQGSNGNASPGFSVKLQLLPQGLKSVLRSGIKLRVSSNEAADGIAKLLISKAAARRAHIHGGGGTSIVVGRGSVTGITNGTVSLRLHLSKGMAAKLRHLRHVKLTVRLTLFAAHGNHVTIDAAGQY